MRRRRRSSSASPATPASTRGRGSECVVLLRIARHPLVVALKRTRPSALVLRLACHAFVVASTMTCPCVVVLRIGSRRIGSPRVRRRTDDDLPVVFVVLRIGSRRIGSPGARRRADDDLSVRLRRSPYRLARCPSPRRRRPARASSSTCQRVAVGARSPHRMPRPRRCVRADPSIALEHHACSTTRSPPRTPRPPHEGPRHTRDREPPSDAAPTTRLPRRIPPDRGAAPRSHAALLTRSPAWASPRVQGPPNASENSAMVDISPRGTSTPSRAISRSVRS
ncbi:hypothetical protein SAMN02745121_07032 [Nannocystis exedens]|uniref:Uncharacterized protein n=1 Tax=Nannocystis exedens TaxID=54 RepID=A0A1I2G4Z3_9BACT|nr:hypothetical protein NAEX_00324 [Nannocystis exedens]SFF12183.1 hypothetical protein SAMN02745121_07032 [Nannocystis exedens]